MTFRTRIVLAATVTAVFAVLAASLGSYLATRNSLVNSVDDTLIASAHSVTVPQSGGLRLTDNAGVFVQVVAAFNDDAGLQHGGTPADGGHEVRRRRTSPGLLHRCDRATARENSASTSCR